jgi:type II secretory pathway predicted ATPase ExeA
MEKHFNTAGPNDVELHYLLDPLARMDIDSLSALIDQRRYFVLHAPRQTGKTTCLLALRDHLNADIDYAALYVNVEAAQAARNDLLIAFQAIVSSVIQQAESTLGIQLSQPETFFKGGPSNAFAGVLRELTQRCKRPLVLFLDEVDSLVGDTLISLLRQIRAGYTDRPKYFPQTIVLCGVRDVRDYRMTMADGEVITGGSAFNIKAESLRLGDFSYDDLVALYQQHTSVTGQIFSAQALELAWESTRGQPWLVNALAEQAVWKAKENRDRSVLIDLARLRQAREALILRNDTHLDQLTDKLKEARVRAVIEPMLVGKRTVDEGADEQYVFDLGLVRREQGSLQPANAIYAEVLPRVLSERAQHAVTHEDIASSWRDQHGVMQPTRFLENFFVFWRRHGEIMIGTVSYHEAAPHLVLMAYLQRVVNGEGRIEREYAAGSGRLDLWVQHGAVQMALELKVWRDQQPDPLTEGLEQIERYLQRLGLSQGFLILFDQRRDAPSWAERGTRSQALTTSGREVIIWRG